MQVLINPVTYAGTIIVPAYVTGFIKTDRNCTRTDIQFIAEHYSTCICDWIYKNRSKLYKN